MIYDIKNILCLKCNAYPKNSSIVFNKCDCSSLRYYQQSKLLAIDFDNYTIVVNFCSNFDIDHLKINSQNKYINQIYQSLFNHKIIYSYKYLSDIYKEIIRTHNNLIFI